MGESIQKIQLDKSIKITDVEALERYLRDSHRGMWIAVLSSGEIIASVRLEAVAEKGKGEIVTLFRVPEKGLVMLR